MNFMDIFPKLCKFFPGITSGLVHFGLALVHFYHVFCGNVVLNTAFDETQGVERVANYILTPIHYICGGKEVSLDPATGKYHLKHRFNYESRKMFYTPFAVTFFSSSLVLGGTLKTMALIWPEVRQKHHQLKRQLTSLEVTPHTKHYRFVGLKVNDYKKGEALVSQGHKRRPGDADLLTLDKEALRNIAEALYKNDIPFWVDCGTLLGTYRYGGIIPWDNDLDIAVLAEDFENVMHALNALDPSKYVAQDWSSRTQPETYIRVYVKETRNHLDIYHMKTDPEERTLTTILAHEDSDWMAEDWKARERMQITPYPYEVIFPLKKADFDGIEVPVPNNTVAYLQGKYGENLNPVKIYDGDTGQYEKDLSHPYWEIPLAH